MAESTKIPKSAVLYIHLKNTDYKCKDCLFRKDGANRCALYGRAVTIRPYGGCGQFIVFKQGTLPELPYWPAGQYTKENTGYVENGAGFTCGRCDEFIADQEDCEKVDKDSPGDDPGKIISSACCNRWVKIKSEQ